MNRANLYRVISEIFLRETLKSKLRVLSEASLSRIITSYMDIGFLIISADRTCEAEKGSPCDPGELAAQNAANKKNQEQIRKDIRSAGFGFVPVHGGYREEKGTNPETGEKEYVDNPITELSFIVPTYGVGTHKPRQDTSELFELGKQLTAKYNQDTFFFKPPKSKGEPAALYSRAGAVEMTFKDMSVNDFHQIFFTQLHKRKAAGKPGKTAPTPKRFSLTTESRVYFLPKKPSGISEALKRYGEIFVS